MLAQSDRISFSLNIVSAPATLNSIAQAKAQVQSQIAALQNLDTANKNLFDPVNAQITQYQIEYSCLDGNGRSAIVEQDIQDAGNKKANNHFFPNNSSVVVPSLSASNNLWTKTVPYALTYAIGKNASEAYSVIAGESPLITQLLAYIASAGTFQDIEATTGQNATAGTPPATDTIQTYPAVQTLKVNMVAAVTSYLSTISTELSSIVTNDTNPTNQTNNNAALAALPTIQTALNTWSAYPDFNTIPGSVTTYSGFYAYNSGLLAPTKLHSTQLAALKTALQARQTFITTRLSQLSSVLGTISQDVNSGLVTSSGLYGKRYGYLALRLNALGGSLSQLLGLQSATSSQDALSANATSTANTYSSIIPTTALAASGNGTAVVNVVNASSFSVKDAVYIYAEGQTELQRAISSISGNQVVLNDVVPPAYSTSINARMYKDLS